jgi:hypothetical protein
MTGEEAAAAHYSLGAANLEEAHRSALLALKASGVPQAVHLHPSGEPCARGECYILRIVT